MATVHLRSVPHVAVRKTLPAWRPSQLLTLLLGWLWRARSRRELAGLSDAQLRDVGLNRDMIKREAEKPFWIA
jgi:uncharacterized protein YjiS (DUF1127 family)